MFIVPFIHKQNIVNNIYINVFRILTVGGHEVWAEDDSASIADILTVNGIVTVVPPVKIDTTYFCKVDAEQTNMSDFYKWEEIEDKDTFCWRTFYAFGQKENYSNWLPIPTNEYIGQYSYKDLLCTLYALHAL